MSFRRKQSRKTLTNIRKKNNSILENYGKPIVKPNTEMIGIASEPAFKGEEVKIIQKISYTSFDIPFHYTVKHLKNIFELNDHNNNVFIRIDNNNKALVYKDNFPLSIGIVTKQKVQQFSSVYLNDIADITSVSFADKVIDCNPKAGEKVIFLYRYNYSFVLYFDLTGELEVSKCQEEIACSIKRLMYYEFYQSMNSAENDSLIEEGWFPFIQLIGDKYYSLCHFINKDKKRIPKWINNNYDETVLRQIVKKWFEKLEFQAKKGPIEEGLECFYNEKYFACISTLTPMIEGIAHEVYKNLNRDNNQLLGHKSGEISNYIYNLASSKFKTEGSLALPDEFKHYLEKFFFKTGMKKENFSIASRHPTAHGRADADSYNIERALQLILTLDQLYYYI